MIIENGEWETMKESEDKQRMNQAAAPATYAAPALEVLEVKIPQGFGDGSPMQ
jgi:hypothetical protein